ncbi:FAD-binding oxidoreductase [Sphingobium boeckii]|uniref:Alkyldihydroxyacetonephosphate synthase n=1 Tax=Sphingobium boeckii TaxID=1082345 RepID=A0A7W9AJB3_9SPHN|nr:FAD-binding oxidoreductase [Sphingobium boeckii]MBB5686608.1 alkyldihydroxyacetonephosphate synthase [Sphingobium boeckii]
MTRFGEMLAAAIGAEQVASDAAALNARRFDQWAVKHLRDWRGEAVPGPGWVVQPCSVEDVRRIVLLANEHRVPLIPFGLGSGVCGGIEPTPESILLDMSAMKSVRFIDDRNLLASFDAGLNGLEAEEAVAALGLTIGHWPQSIGISSVGGWVATRASGQFSTAYGNVEDIIHSIEAVLPNGEIVTLGKAVRAAAGPDLRHLLMGAEGTMGVITGVTFSIRAKPEYRGYSIFYAPDMEAGFEAQRRIIRADWRPPVMRQYDGREVRRLFRDHERDGQAMLLMVHEGPQARVEAEIAAMAALTGLEPGDPKAAQDWIERRNHVPTWRDMFERGYIADTVEISGTWSQIGAIYADAIAALNAVPGVVNASAHSSHVYRSGINLYFSFAATFEDKAKMEPAYFACWHAIMEATAKHGGGVAHHHGAGRLRKPYLQHDLGANGVALLRTIKAALDPHGIMNPGNLIPDA